MNPLEKRQFKNQLYSQIAKVSKALANNHRLELLELLTQSERSVEQLAKETNLSLANASQHLQVLLGAGLLEQRRQGVFIFYKSNPDAYKLWQSLRDFAQVHLGLDRFVQKIIAEEAVTLEELQARLEKGKIILLDVRPTTEFNTAHILGAKSVPLEELEAFMPHLSKKQMIVAYCRGPFCVFADEAVVLLRANGFQAKRFALGVPDWQDAGYPIGVSA